MHLAGEACRKSCNGWIGRPRVNRLPSGSRLYQIEFSEESVLFVEDLEAMPRCLNYSKGASVSLNGLLYLHSGRIAGNPVWHTGETSGHKYGAARGYLDTGRAKRGGKR